MQMWKVAALVLEGCCLSLGSNQELILCLKVRLQGLVLDVWLDLVAGRQGSCIPLLPLGSSPQPPVCISVPSPDPSTVRRRCLAPRASSVSINSETIILLALVALSASQGICGCVECLGGRRGRKQSHAPGSSGSGSPQPPSCGPCPAYVRCVAA